jgi:hypothetical protein
MKINAEKFKNISTIFPEKNKKITPKISSQKTKKKAQATKAIKAFTVDLSFF